MSSRWWAAFIIAVDVIPPAPGGGWTWRTTPPPSFRLLTLSYCTKWMALNPNTFTPFWLRKTQPSTNIPSFYRNAYMLSWHKSVDFFYVTFSSIVWHHQNVSNKHRKSCWKSYSALSLFYTSYCKKVLRKLVFLSKTTLSQAMYVCVCVHIFNFTCLSFVFYLSVWTG